MDSNFDFDRVHEKMVWSMAEHILVNYLHGKLSGALSDRGMVDWERDITPYLTTVQNADPKLVKDLSRCDLSVLVTLYHKKYVSLLPSQIKRHHLYLLRKVRNQFAHQTSRVGEEDVHFSDWEPVVRMFFDCLGVIPAEIQQYELLRDAKFRSPQSGNVDKSASSDNDHIEHSLPEYCGQNEVYVASIQSSSVRRTIPSDFQLGTISAITEQVLGQRVSFVPETESSSNLSISEFICSTQQYCCFISKCQQTGPVELVNNILKAVYDRFGSDLLQSLDFSIDKVIKQSSPIAYWLMLVRCLTALDGDNVKPLLVCIESVDSRPGHVRKLVQSIVDTAPSFIRFLFDSSFSVSGTVAIECGKPIRDYFAEKIKHLLSKRVVDDELNNIIEMTCVNAVYAEVSYRTINKLLTANLPIDVILPEDKNHDWLCYFLSTLLLPSHLASLVAKCYSVKGGYVETNESNEVLIEYAIVSSSDCVRIHPTIVNVLQTHFSHVT